MIHPRVYSDYLPRSAKLRQRLRVIFVKDRRFSAALNIPINFERNYETPEPFPGARNAPGGTVGQNFWWSRTRDEPPTTATAAAAARTDRWTGAEVVGGYNKPAKRGMPFKRDLVDHLRPLPCS